MTPVGINYAAFDSYLVVGQAFFGYFTRPDAPCRRRLCCEITKDRSLGGVKIYTLILDIGRSCFMASYDTKPAVSDASRIGLAA